MAYGGKYQNLQRDLHNILWTTYFSERDYELPITVKYGLRYNWYAINEIDYLLAADGWHVPSETEWQTLATNLGGDTIAGGPMKEIGYTWWNTPNTGATNTSKFNAKGGGIRINDGSFTSQKNTEVMWICKTFAENEIYARTLLYNMAGLYYSYSDGSDETINKKYGLPVRLIKDSTSLVEGQSGTYTGNDGKVYRTIAIGDPAQEWLADPLCETKYRGGYDIPEVTGNAAWAALTTGAMCAWNNDWDEVYSETEPSYTQLVGAGEEPLRIELVNQSDDIFSPIKSSRAVITVWSASMFALKDFYSVDKMFHLVEIFQGENLYWKGYIDPKQYKEKYGPVPYEVSLVAADGLTLLQNIRYEQSAGVPYDGLKFASEIILDILDKIGFYSFTEFVNVYDTLMDDSVDDSPFDQLKINTDVFEDKYCDEVLTEILKIFNANIRQAGGAFCIYRPVDLTKTTVYGRTFTGATTKTSTSITPKQLLTRPGSSTALLQVSESVASCMDPAKKVTCKQDFGNRDSWIDNWDFKAENYDDTAKTLEKWSFENGSYKDIFHISEFLSSEQEGIALGTTNPLQAVYLEQEIGETLLSYTDLFTLEFEFAWFNNIGSPNNSVTNIYLEITCSSYYLKEKDDTYAEWSLTPSAITIFPVDVLGSTTVQNGFTGWFKYTRIVDYIPATTELGKLNIKLGSQLIGDVYNCYKYVKFFVGSFKVFQKLSHELKPVGPVRPQRVSTLSRLKFNYEQIQKVENIYVKTNNIEGAELEYDYLLGDILNTGITNVLGQFRGALAAYVSETLSATSQWHTRDNLENKPLLELITDEIAALYSKPRQFVDMAITETEKAATVIKLIGNFQDKLNVSESYLRAFFANRGTFNIRYRRWQLDMIEIGKGDPESGGPESITVDSTTITVDSTSITVDQT